MISSTKLTGDFMKKNKKLLKTTPPSLSEPLRYHIGKPQEHFVDKDAFVIVSEDGGISEVGEEGIAICGFLGKAITGKNGIAFAEIGGRAQGDLGSALVFIHLNENQQIRCKTVYVGEDGILPNQPYMLTPQNQIMPEYQVE